MNNREASSTLPEPCEADDVDVALREPSIPLSKAKGNFYSAQLEPANGEGNGNGNGNGETNGGGFGLMNECLNDEQSTQASLEQEEQEPEPSAPVEDTNRPHLPVRPPANPAAERLAQFLFKLLDQPKDQIQNAAQWESQVASLLAEKHTEAEIQTVMEFAIKQNDYSAVYITMARNPMASFVKTYDNLARRCKALAKGAAAAANRAVKLNQPSATETNPAPGAHGTNSGMEF